MVVPVRASDTYTALVQVYVELLGEIKKGNAQIRNIRKLYNFPE